MPKGIQNPDSISTLRNRLRPADQAASEVLLAVDSFRVALRQVAMALDNLPEVRLLSRPGPSPELGVSPVPERPARILRPRTVTQLVGLSRTTLWRMERTGHFPQRRRIGATAIGWLAEDVENWIRTRSTGS